jgi:hypothetical protein
MHADLTHAIRLLTTLGACLWLIGCATTAESTGRASLTNEEISSLKPELTIHSNCVVSKFGDYAAGSNDVRLIVDTVIQSCRAALAPLSERLAKLNLTPSSRDAYLRAVETSSYKVLTDTLLKARSRAAKPDPSNLDSNI